MSTRILAVPLVLSLLLAACAGGDVTDSPEPTRPTVTSPATSTTLAATTTTIPQLSVEGAPEVLTALVAAFYGYASGEIADPPAMVDAVKSSIAPPMVAAPSGGTASLGTFHGQQVGVVEIGDDVFLVVDDGSGWRIVGGTWPSLGVPAYFGVGPRLIAVVGSDARPGEPMDRTRADSIHFLALDGQGSGALVGLPRDSWVGVPGIGNTKVNSTLASGGTETMMATFSELTGLSFEGYVLTGFVGFQEMLGVVLGGINLNIPFDIEDRWAGVALRAGEQYINGVAGLGFARARKTVPGGDLTRSKHQGDILVGSARKVQMLGYGVIPRFMELSEPHMMTNLTPEALLTFSAMIVFSNLDSVANVVAPGRPGSAGGASVVYLNESVGSLWADLADGRLDG